MKSYMRNIHLHFVTPLFLTLNGPTRMLYLIGNLILITQRAQEPQHTTIEALYTCSYSFLTIGVLSFLVIIIPIGVGALSLNSTIICSVIAFGAIGLFTSVNKAME